MGVYSIEKKQLSAKGMLAKVRSLSSNHVVILIHNFSSIRDGCNFSLLQKGVALFLNHSFKRDA